MMNEERLANVARHVEVLQMLLNKQAPSGATQRIYRSRGMIDNEYLVFTIVQNLSGYQPAYGQPDIKLQIYVTRSYKYTTFGAVPVPSTTLSGQYPVDAIVAFLALDTIPVESLHWTDETQYLLIADKLQSLALHG